MVIPLLQDATIRLLRNSPFFGHLLLQFRKVVGTLDHPLGVTLQGGVPTLVVDERRFGLVDDAGREALLEHCVRHLLHLHMARGKGRDRKIWDLAADLTVNPAIPELAETAPTPSRLHLPEGLAAEEYYDLLKPAFSTGSMDGGGVGNVETGKGERKGEGRDDESLTPDDHGVWNEADATPLPLAEEVVRSMVRDAWKEASDNLPDDLRGIVAACLEPSAVPWQQVLRQFIATAGRTGRTTSWKREHRRFGHDVPGVRRRRKLNLLIGIDVSESTDRAPLRERFAAEIVRIAQGREAVITVLYANSRIQRIDAFSGRPTVVEAYHGGGFTDLRPVFAYAREMKPLPAAVIYLTDGKGPAPDKMDFPTLWVLPEDGEKPVPWGVELRLAGEAGRRIE